MSFLATARDDVKAADAILAADAPLKQLACKRRLVMAFASETERAMVTTYCANIPTSVLQAVDTLAKVGLAAGVASLAP